MKTVSCLLSKGTLGGSAKQARDKNFQAIMPIRGKILNTWEVSSDEVLASHGRYMILRCHGVDPGSDDDLNYVMAKSVFLPMQTRMVYISRDITLCVVCEAFPDFS